MPSFEESVDVDITPEEFVYECNDEDIKELARILREDYHEIIDPNFYRSQSFSIAEQEYENSINALHGKWNTLTKEEEDTILAIAKRFS